MSTLMFMKKRLSPGKFFVAARCKLGYSGLDRAIYQMEADELGEFYAFEIFTQRLDKFVICSSRSDHSDRSRRHRRIEPISDSSLFPQARASSCGIL